MNAPAVAVRQVSKTFLRQRQTVHALRDVSLDIEQGEFFGLLGPNGAGKTTLISCMAGLCRQDTGAIRILGHDTRDDYRAARRALGVVPQELVFDPFFSVREILRLQSGYFGLPKNDAWIDELLAERGMTLTRLSELVGVSVVNLSILKNDRARAIRYSTLSAICRALDCEVGDLLVRADAR